MSRQAGLQIRVQGPGYYNSGVPIFKGRFWGRLRLVFRCPRPGSIRFALRQGFNFAPLNDQYTEWLLTTGDGRVERYTKLKDAFKMNAAFAAGGGFATYTYDLENRLVLITDNNGRAIKINWNRGEGDSIDALNGGVRYEYGQAPVAGQGTLRCQSPCW